MVSRPRIAVLHAPGTNRDGEAAEALELSGAEPAVVLLTDLAAGRTTLDDFAGVLVPGGFSYGDALGAGSRLALEVGHALSAYAADGARPVLGICNGFQALVRAGLLGGGDDGAGGGPATPRVATLADNAGGRFECRWVTLAAEPNCTADWVGGIDHLVACPVAHGEGRIAVRSLADAADLAGRGLVALRYVNRDGSAAVGAYPANPNGSAADIAGLANPAGNVVGLMPHPEDHVRDSQDAFRGRYPGRLARTLFDRFVARARAH